MCHQYRISVLVPWNSFHRETSGGVAKCRLFSLNISKYRKINTENKYNIILPQGILYYCFLLISTISWQQPIN